jgi:hypothetical protein
MAVEAVGWSVGGAGVAGSDHDGDALGGKLGKVGVDDGEVILLASDRVKVALPAVRDGVDEGHVSGGGEFRGPLVDGVAEIAAGDFPEFSLYADRGTCKGGRDKMSLAI